MAILDQVGNAGNRASKSLRMEMPETWSDYATKELTDGELEQAKESMRNFLHKEAARALAPYAHKAGTAKKAPWVFEDRQGMRLS